MLTDTTLTLAAEASADLPPAHWLDPQTDSITAAHALVTLYDAFASASAAGVIRNGSLAVHGDRPAHVLAIWARRRRLEAQELTLPRRAADAHAYRYVKVRLPGDASISAHFEPATIEAESAEVTCG